MTLDGGAGSNPAPAFDDSSKEEGRGSFFFAAAVAAAVAAAAACSSVAEGDARATPPLASVPDLRGPRARPLFRSRSEREKETKREAEAAERRRGRKLKSKVPPDGLGRGKLGYRYVRRRRANPVGWALMLLWAASLAYYLYVRLVFTLKGEEKSFSFAERERERTKRRQKDERKKTQHSSLFFLSLLPSPKPKQPGLGSVLPYGILLLVVEVLGATTVLVYGINLLFNPLHEKPPSTRTTPRMSLPPGAPVPSFEMPKVALPYHVRVLVPCYKEELEICQRTVLGGRGRPLARRAARGPSTCAMTGVTKRRGTGSGPWGTPPSSSTSLEGSGRRAR